MATLASSSSTRPPSAVRAQPRRPVGVLPRLRRKGWILELGRVALESSPERRRSGWAQELAINVRPPPTRIRPRSAHPSLLEPCFDLARPRRPHAQRPFRTLILRSHRPPHRRRRRRRARRARQARDGSWRYRVVLDQRTFASFDPSLEGMPLYDESEWMHDWEDVVAKLDALHCWNLHSVTVHPAIAARVEQALAARDVDPHALARWRSVIARARSEGS